MYLNVFLKLKKPLNPLFWAKNPKKPKKPQKTQKNPKNPKKTKKPKKPKKNHWAGLKKKKRVFSNPDLYTDFFNSVFKAFPVLNKFLLIIL
jgi:hypothetical protein